jgi:hypothetical protein
MYILICKIHTLIYKSWIGPGPVGHNFERWPSKDHEFYRLKCTFYILKCKIYRLKCKFYRLKCEFYRLKCKFYRLKCKF